MDTDLDKLKEIGFIHAGTWHLEDDVLKLQFGTHSTNKEILYAFVRDTEVLYLGKTNQGISKRLGQHRMPGPTQFTNQKTNRNLINHLQQRDSIDIWMFVDDRPAKYGAFKLNLAAGLEDSIIAVLKPPWNGSNHQVE